MIITTQLPPPSTKIDFMWENGIYLGYAYKEVDGYYVFMFEEGVNGIWESYVLRAIADKLTELNKPWDDQINKYFENEKHKEQKTKS